MQEMVYFLLGEDEEAETQATISQNPLRHRLIEHCDHLSDEVVIAQALLSLLPPPSFPPIPFFFSVIADPHFFPIQSFLP